MVLCRHRKPRTSNREEIVSMHRTLSYLVAAVLFAPAMLGFAPARAEDAPKFQVEPFWPKPLPKNWILGQVAGIAVANDDHIWVVHRPATRRARCRTRPRANAARRRSRCSSSTPTAICCARGAVRAKATTGPRWS